jgi:hypothetical protein
MLPNINNSSINNQELKILHENRLQRIYNDGVCQPKVGLKSNSSSSSSSFPSSSSSSTSSSSSSSSVVRNRHMKKVNFNRLLEEQASLQYIQLNERQGNKASNIDNHNNNNNNNGSSATNSMVLFDCDIPAVQHFHDIKRMTIITRNISTHIMDFLATAQALAGCVAWVTHEGILDSLIQRRTPISLVIQRERYLTPETMTAYEKIHKGKFAKRLQQQLTALTPWC